MKKILHIITRIDEGGSAQNTLLTIKYLSNRYNFCLVTGKISNNISVSSPTYIIPEIKREINPLLDFISLVKLCKLIKRNKFDIVHAHSSKGGFVGRLASIICGVKKIIYTPHGHIFYGYFPYFISQIFILIERFLSRFTNVLIALTENEAKEYKKYRLKPKEFAVIHSGIKIDKFSNVSVDKINKRKELGLTEKNFVIVSHNRLVKVKGYRYLIYAAKKVIEKFSNAIFLIIGDGEEREKLEKLVHILNIDNNVKFLGKRNDIPEILAISDLFVITSINEGMGRSIVEAMACGLPVVATNACGIPNVVINNKTGIIVEKKNIEQIANAIIKLIENKELAKNMGNYGKIVAKNFSVEKMVEKLLALYNRL